MFNANEVSVTSGLLFVSENLESEKTRSLLSCKIDFLESRKDSNNHYSNSKLVGHKISTSNLYSIIRKENFNQMLKVERP